jgi:hypothetical protein
VLAGHGEGVRVGALACLVALASLACRGGEVVLSDAGAPPAIGAQPEGAPSGASSSGGGAPPGVGPSPVSSSWSEDGGCAALQGNVAPLPLGAPCFSFREEASSFPGSVEQEVSVEANGPLCGESNVCLYNHFLGRVTCPYGQDKGGAGPGGTPGCQTADTCEPVRPNDPETGQTVPAQCSDRTAASAVYCSCRCANAQGGTSDGAYCQCPSGMTCTQVVATLGGPPATDDISGAYCLKTGTQWDGGSCEGHCDPSSAPCP